MFNSDYNNKCCLFYGCLHPIDEEPGNQKRKTMQRKIIHLFTEYRYIEQDVDSVYSDEYREVELGCKPAQEDLAGKKSTILNFISLI